MIRRKLATVFAMAIVMLVLPALAEEPSLPEGLDGPEMHGVRFALLLVGLHFMVSF